MLRPAIGTTAHEDARPGMKCLRGHWLCPSAENWAHAALGAKPAMLLT